MLDADGYPDEASLLAIEKYDLLKQPLGGLLALIRDNWWSPDWGCYRRNGVVLELHTGGWSGNEDVIESLQRNYMFWQTCWESSRRGGHYRFLLNGEVI